MTTISAIPAGNRSAFSATDESAVINMEQRVQAKMRNVDADSPIDETGADEPNEAEKAIKASNIELCRQLLVKQILMDMVIKNQDDEHKEWLKEWL